MANIIRVATITAAVGVLSACVQPTPAFDRHFGEATRIMAAQQTRNPDAPVANASKLPDGLDGRAARDTIDRYQRGFVEPPRAGGFVIGVGAGGADTLGPPGR